MVETRETSRCFLRWSSLWRLRSISRSPISSLRDFREVEIYNFVTELIPLSTTAGIVTVCAGIGRNKKIWEVDPLARSLPLVAYLPQMHWGDANYQFHLQKDGDQEISECARLRDTDTLEFI